MTPMALRRPHEKFPGFNFDLCAYFICVAIAYLGWPPEDSRAYWGPFIMTFVGPFYIAWKYFLSPPGS